MTGVGMRERLMVRLIEWRYRLTKRRERLLMALVWKLPRSIVMWSTVRVIANATTGAHSNQVVPELTAMEALERWEYGR
jgi:hypothetical protein